ncbi:MAG: M1 family metallopeptidase [Eubacteriales bacterium]|nr:M1 family metallopeptidase [Eubacteriales bacterium]
MKKKKLLWLAGVLVVALIAVALWVSQPKPALKPPGQELLKAAQGLDEIEIEATLLPDARTLEVHQTLRLTSTVEESRDQLVLRTYPNAFQSLDGSPCAMDDQNERYYPTGFSSGALVISEALVAKSGQEARAVQYRYTDEAKTMLMLPLEEPWRTGEQVTVTLTYGIVVPKAAYRFGLQEDTFALGNAFIIPAVWENGAYRTDAYGSIGDPFLSDVANYTVTLTVPKGYRCAATGYAEEEADGEKTIYRFRSLAVRDFAMVIGPHLQQAQAMAGDTLLNILSSDRSEEIAGYVKKALETFEGLYGAYPYQSLSVGEIVCPDAGMEYPAMVMLGSDTVAAGGRELEYAVVHEVAHQWWYAVVGSDSISDAWQDEALCEYSLLTYVGQRYGAGEREALYESRVAPSMRVTIPSGVTPGAPLDYFSSMGQYVILAYNRATAMLCALDEMMGGGLNDFLRGYYQRYAFGRASRADFTALLTALTGEDYEPLMVDYLDTEMK